MYELSEFFQTLNMTALLAAGLLLWRGRDKAAGCMFGLAGLSAAIWLILIAVSAVNAYR